MSKEPPRLSVVDYDAWKRGYMPPAEHQLIHQLSYEGAKVVTASVGSKHGWWLVVKGGVDRKKLGHVAKQLYMTMEFLDEDSAENDPPTPLAASSYGED